MADREHVEAIIRSVEGWNRWRLAHPDVTPDFAGADLGDAALSGADLSQADLSRSNLKHANLGLSKLREANLIETDLTEADLTRSDLSGANLGDADLSRADLTEANLHRSSFHGANLSAANLRRSNLWRTAFHRADLRNANFGGADLSATSFLEADLRWANFSWTTFNGTHLQGADLTGAVLTKTAFADTDLSGVKGLAEVIHVGPSTIGIDTIYKSGGKIPEVFLRGAGIPDNFIAYARSLVGKPIEFYSCFISYSTKDQEFAERLYADLQAKGVRCWFAPEDTAGGKKLYDQIDEAIRLHDRLLLVLSSASIASHWVKTEISAARAQEKRTGRRVLFPIRLVEFEALSGWDWADDAVSEIRDFFIPDFSHWKDHDRYQKAFERLLRDLNPAPSRPATAG